jgi:RNA polymerase sigma-70 factor (ECF subfamily)
VARIIWKGHLRHHGRAASAQVPLDDVEATVTSDPDALDVAERKEERDRVRAAVATLSAEQREAFVLRHYQGFTYEEIARVMGTPLGTVKWRIHEAVRRLEQAIASRHARGSVE